MCNHMLGPCIPIVYVLIKGREATSPVPLSEAGEPLEVTDALHYVEFDPYEDIDFNTYF